jgi:hypothetical protein
MVPFEAHPTVASAQRESLMLLEGGCAQESAPGRSAPTFHGPTAAAATWGSAMRPSDPIRTGGREPVLLIGGTATSHFMNP